MEAPPEPSAMLGGGSGSRIQGGWGTSRCLTLLLAIAIPLLVYRLGAKDIWEASEGRPPESAREMRERGDYLVQYTNGQVDLTKPPVYAWLTGAAFAVTGADTEWAARLPSVLASLGILLLTFRLGRRIAGPRAGLLSALDAKTGAARARAFALFHLGLGFAFAVKGPIALILVLPGSIACALAERRGRALLSSAFLATAQIALVVGLAWYLAVVLRDRAYLDVFLSYGAGENVGHLQNPFYYLWTYPLYALPWTPIVLLGMRLPFARDVDPDLRAGSRLPYVAFAVTVVALSCLHPKQTHYLIPIFPMGATLGGLWLDRFLGRCTPDSEGARRAPLPSEPKPDWGRGDPCGLPVPGNANRRGALVVGAFAVVVLTFLYGLGHYLPGLNREQSSRDFMEKVAARVPPGSSIGWTIFGSHSDFLWYLPMGLVTRDGIPELVGETEEQTVAKVSAFLRKPGMHYAIVTGPQADALGPAARVLVRDDAFQKKGRHVALVTAVPQGGPR